MSLISVMRRWHFRDGLSKREITKRTGLSRNTVRRYLNSKIIDPAYPKRQSLSKLDEFEEVLTGWLHRESRRHRKQRKSVKQLHQDLVKLGFSGSYDRVAAFARQWREAQRLSVNKHAYVPLSFALGEAFQFDWGENRAFIDGRNVKLQVAHFKLSHSRAVYLRAYWTQTHEMLFDSHNHAFKFYGGVPERGIYDNMKTAVDKVGKGKERTVNRKFQAMVSHYLFDADFCNPAAGWEKGQVEKAVRDSRYAIWHTAPKFKSLSELNNWLELKCRLVNQQTKHPQLNNQTVEEVWQREKPHLMAIDAPFDGFVEHTKRVSSTCLVGFERNKYSVPASFANRLLSLRVYPEYLDFVAEGRQIARHKRLFNRDHNMGQTIYDWRHYLLVAQRKPGALRNGAPFQTMPDSFRYLQSILLSRKGGDKEMVEILALVLHHDEADVEQAITKAIEMGAPSKEHVINCLSRLTLPEPPAPLPVQTALQLNVEPTSDTSRYEQLRTKRHAH